MFHVVFMNKDIKKNKSVDFRVFWVKHITPNNLPFYTFFNLGEDNVN